MSGHYFLVLPRYDKQKYVLVCFNMGLTNAYLWQKKVLRFDSFSWWKTSNCTFYVLHCVNCYCPHTKKSYNIFCSLLMSTFRILNKIGRPFYLSGDIAIFNFYHIVTKVENCDKLPKQKSVPIFFRYWMFSWVVRIFSVRAGTIHTVQNMKYTIWCFSQGKTVKSQTFFCHE